MSTGHPLASALDAAEMLTARGWVVFPADNPDAGLHCTGTARRCVARQCGAATDPHKRGKHPRVDRWGSLGVASTAQLAEWFADPVTPVNVALACGPSGLLVIDEDTDGALSAYAASIGEVVPDTFRVRTGRGWHWYFGVPIDPGTGQRYLIGNSPGALGGWGCDVRGGASASAEHGGYVITAGSRHWSGVTYTADEPYAAAVTATPWLIAALLDPAPLAPYQAAGSTGERTGNGAAPVDGGEADRGGDRGAAGSGATVARERGTAPSGSGQGVTRWDKSPRYGSRAELWAQYRRHCDEVRHEGAEFRHELFRAARDGWRLVGLALLDEESMLDELAQCVARVWHSEPDDRDAKIVYEEALDGPSGALASPWELAEPIARRPAEIEPGRLFTRPGDVVPAGQSGSAPPVDGQRAVAEVTEGERPAVVLDLPPLTGDPNLDHEVEVYARRKLARDLVEARHAPDVTRMSARGLMSAPRPRYLVDGMLYRDGLAVMFGAPGAAKSFLALDIALSYVTGRPWRGTVLHGDNGAPGMVHYVMAEGQATNGARMAAWIHHHGCDITEQDAIDARFIPFTEAIMLTEAGIKPYLPHVRNDQPRIIIFDTKNLMFAGKESQGEDYGAMLRVLHTIRRAAGGCCIILIDHSGLNATGRVRGSNAQIGGVDTEIMVSHDQESGLRLAEMTRDKNARKDAPEWCFRLQPVDDVPREAGEPCPAVCVPAERDGTPFIRPGEDWWSDPLPGEIADLITDARYAKGADAGKAMRGKDAARDIVRVLRSIGGAEGLTSGGLGTRLREGPRDYSPAQVDTGITLLLAVGVLARSGTSTVKYVLMSRYGREGDAE